MRLVKFQRAPRGVLYVNPDHVISVTDEPEGTNASVICLAQGGGEPVRYEVRGQVAEVAAALAGANEAGEALKPHPRRPDADAA
jgi:hypothetical protein